MNKTTVQTKSSVAIANGGVSPIAIRQRFFERREIISVKDYVL
ncbi:hypothetical protein [Brunnivagina elsteri]